MPSLAEELGKPLQQVLIEFASYERPVSVTLLRDDGSGLTIRCESHDIAERVEVGALTFRCAAPPNNVTAFNLPRSFNGRIDAFKLVIEESGTTIESGLILRAPNGDEMLIVAGVYPGSLAIQGIASAPHTFEPEYSVDQYTRIPFS